MRVFAIKNIKYGGYLRKFNNLFDNDPKYYNTINTDTIIDNNRNDIENFIKNNNLKNCKVVEIEIPDYTDIDIKIDYKGDYPCLCYGQLYVTINDKQYDFGTDALTSGGFCVYEPEEIIEEGDWQVTFPKDFPEDIKLRELVVDKINEDIPHGCCGGCI